MRPLAEVSPDRIVERWAYACAPLTRYRLDAEIVRQNLYDHPLFHPTASFWDEDAFVAVKRSAASLYEGPDPKTAHLSLLGGTPERLAPLLRRTTEVLRSEGIATLVFGTDSGHFLPGAPVDVEWLDAWLEKEGFVAGGMANDLERNMGGYVLPPGLPDGEFRRMVAGDEASLDEFLLREFPGRWRYDVDQKVASEGIETVLGLFIGGDCEGFALLQREGCRSPIGGAVWRNDLGPNWGSLGPIGISKRVRGKGFGNALLGHALAELARGGARRAIIDWTGLVDFYGAHGFVVTRSYRAYRLTLGPPV